MNMNKKKNNEKVNAVDTEVNDTKKEKQNMLQIQWMFYNLVSQVLINVLQEV